MKFVVQMKDPDGPIDSIDAAAEDSVARESSLDEEEREAILEIRKQKLRDFADQWLEYGEYVRVEFDTEAGTATVLKKNR